MGENEAILTGTQMQKFLAHHEYLHDAELCAISKDLGNLSVTLRGLCIIDRETNWWRTTDTEATLKFDGVVDCTQSGELREYGVMSFDLVSPHAFTLVSNAGGLLSARFQTFRINARYSTEPNPYR